MDFNPDHEILRPWIEQGMTFVQDQVTAENMGALLENNISQRATC